MYCDECKDQAHAEKGKMEDDYRKLMDNNIALAKLLEAANLQNGELAEALKAFLAVDNGGFETRNAAENSYCPDCANESDSWRDQTEHHTGCGYLARIEAAKAAISKATIPTTPVKRKCEHQPCDCQDCAKYGAVCRKCDHPVS